MASPPAKREGSSGSGEAQTRCGFVALIGAPNSGKSTLTNALVGAKVSIVTHKAQTTRGPVRGIALIGDAQVIFVDTPGIFQPKRRLDRAMFASAWDRAGDADIVVLVIDAQRGLDRSLDTLFKHLPEVRRPIVAVLNKIDQVAKPDLLRLATDLSAIRPFDRVFMLSALTGDGVADLKAYLAEAVPPGPWLFPEDQLTDASLRQSAAEITREKLFLRLHEELPYTLTVETADWKELAAGSIRIEQTIYVERESQRKIVLGAKGQTIKEIGSAARADIGEMAGVKVHLFLFVKVRERWADDPERYREMGLDYPKDKA
ncbi:MAG: GTPase Era [Methyloceanibacter sp.]|nr:GTPase Era [Methyloceanibacter sp.]